VFEGKKWDENREDREEVGEGVPPGMLARQIETVRGRLGE